MDMNSVLQLINDKLAKTVLSNQTPLTVSRIAASVGTAAGAGPPASTAAGLPCNLPPMIPFSVPASFRFRSKEDTHNRHDGAAATLQCLKHGEKKDADEKGGGDGGGGGRGPAPMMNGGPRTSSITTTDNARKYNTRFMEYYGMCRIKFNSLQCSLCSN